MSANNLSVSSSVWATQSSAPAQQWNQPSGSNAAVNVNTANTNVGQNSAMWPPAGAAGTYQKVYDFIFYLLFFYKRNTFINSKNFSNYNNHAITTTTNCESCIGWTRCTQCNCQSDGYTECRST